MVQLLLAAEGVDVNQVDPSTGNFPLLIAADDGHAEVVRLLLARGADPLMTWNGKPLLKVALDAGHAAVVKLLERRWQEQEAF